jgi:uncharacterized protein with HEPN domain
MKDNIGDKARLNHIFEALNEIEDFTKGLTYDDYMKNSMLRHALVRLLEIISEASHHISADLKSEFSEIEWLALKGLRNVLTHEYFGVDYNLVWNLIVDRVPELKTKINLILVEKFIN